jgi:hypothetical protein
MAIPPPPFANVTGIARADMKYNAQETFANYDGNFARPGELVVNLEVDPPTVWVGNNIGQLTQVGQGSGNGVPGGPVNSVQLNSGNGFVGTTNFIFSGGNLSLSGNLLPGASNVYSLGSPTLQWSSAYINANTIYLNNIPLSGNANNLSYNGLPLVPASNTAPPSAANISTTAALNGANLVISNATPGGGITFADGSKQTASYANANVEVYLPVSNTIVAINANLANTNGNLSNLASTTANSFTSVNANVANNTANITTLQGVVYANSNVSMFLASGNTSANIATTGAVKAGNIVISANGAITFGDSTTQNTAPTWDTLANKNNLSGPTEIALGQNAGANTQGSQSIAIGVTAGQITQGDDAVAVGSLAGQGAQGSYSVAVGSRAGYAGQKQSAVAVGPFAGYDRQGNSAVAIGDNTAYSTQGDNAIAIGAAAGDVNQGANAVAVGANAGTSNQANNSIVINATGSALQNNTANSLVVAPVRQVTSTNAWTNPTHTLPTGFFFTAYNPTTGELIYWS